MTEKIQGNGQLEKWQGPEKPIPVRYRFSITVRVIGEGASTERSSVGSVQAISGEAIPEGEYRLILEDGEAVRVKNLGFSGWTILSS